MSLRRNIIANYLCQLYITAIGILMVPLYIKYMGAEAYGLVGVFAMLQAFFNLLDMGLSPTVARESARYNGGATSALDYRRLVRALEGIFVAVAVLGGGLLFALAAPMAGHWLNATQLPLSEITPALRLMSIIISLRWMCGLYRGVISGAERLVWLSGFNSIVATIRFILVLPVLIYISASPLTFFGFQFGLAVLEFFGLLLMSYRIMPAIPVGQHIAWQWEPLRPVLKFSLSIAFTSSVWVLLTQSDKLVLSKILPLADYGYFTVATLVAGGIMTLSSPISGAILPRLANLEAQSKHDEIIKVYRQITRLVSTTVGGCALFIFFFSSEILRAWTGNAELTQYAAPILSIYAIGNCILASSAFPYYIQYAKGDLRLHVYGNLIFVLILIPAIIIVANKHGGVGAAYVWLVMNIFYMAFWTPFVHKKFLPGLHFSWVLNDFLRPLLGTFFLCVLFRELINFSNERVLIVLQLVIVFFAVAILSFILNKSAFKIIRI